MPAHGARGYVTKTSAGLDLVDAVEAVTNGDLYISAGITAVTVLTHRSNVGSATSCEHLSEREFTVLRFLVAGMSSSQIALKLSLSSKTVDTYRHRLMVKMGVINRAELIRVAVQYELTAV